MNPRFLRWLMLIPLVMVVLAAGNKASAQREPDIWFENSIMEQIAFIGAEFTYDFDAQTKDNVEVRYELVDLKEDLPEGMTIDAETGVVRWTPQNYGDYMVWVRAYIVGEPDKSAETGFYLMVVDSSDYKSPCATITGTVLMQPGNEPVRDAYIQVFSSDSNSRWNRGFYAVTDENGQYSVEVPDGSYYIMLSVKSPTNAGTIFYPDATDFQNAEIVNIECEETFTANFSIDADLFTYVYFENYPEQYYVSPGEKFSWDADAVSSNNGSLTYELIPAPEGMTVDAQTGLVEWTPQEKGYFSFVLRAYLTDKPDKFAEMYYDIWVADRDEIEPCAWFHGRLTDEDGNPVYGSVMAFSSDSSGYMKRQNGVFYAETDQDGYYTLYVPKGDYYLMAQGNFCDWEFYENAKNYEDATSLSIVCDDTIAVNFQLDKYELGNLYTITGRVTSETTGNPVNAMVHFMPQDKYIPEGDYDNDGQIDYLNLVAQTDQDGNYSIRLPENVTFVAVAFPLESTYLPEYYNNTDDWSLAEGIVLTGDRNDINFTLGDAPNYNNSFSGRVEDAEGNPVSALVIAIGNTMADPNGTYREKSYTVSTDSSTAGTFSFSNLEPDNYVLMAIPYNETLVPGFYVENDFATLEWDKATVIELSENQNIEEPFVIKLQQGSELYGVGVLEGYIENSETVLKNSNSKIQGGSGIPGVLVAAKDINDKVIDHCYSDNNGYYKLDKLGVGEYKIVASKSGFESFETSMDFDTKDKAMQNHNIRLQPKSATGVNDNETPNSGLSVYPNPVSDLLSIKLEGLSGEGTVSVTDLLGRDVLSRSISLNSGSVNLNVMHLTPGRYMLRIMNGPKLLQIPFSIVR